MTYDWRQHTDGKKTGKKRKKGPPQEWMTKQGARAPRDSDKTSFTAEQLRENFTDLFPDVDLQAALDDPSNKSKSEAVLTAVSLMRVVSATSLVWKSREEGPNPWFLDKLGKVLTDHAKLTGVIDSAKVIKVPADPRQEILMLLGLSPEQGEEMAKAVLGATPANRVLEIGRPKEIKRVGPDGDSGT